MYHRRIAAGKHTPRVTVLKGMRVWHCPCITNTRGVTMRKLKLFCVMALLGGVLSMLTPQASAKMVKKNHHHHGHQYQKAHLK